MFEGFKKPTSISIPASLSSSDYNTSSLYYNEAFSGTYYYAGAFGGSYIKNVVIENGNNIIPNYLFSGAAYLETVLIPESVLNIGEYAFFNCKSLSSVYFTGSDYQWEQVYINCNNTPLDGATVLFGGNDKGKYEYKIVNSQVIITKGYQSSSGQVIIPDYIDGYPVTSIDYAAFLNCKGITSIILPDTVTYIDDNAFAGCESLTTVWLGNSTSYIGNSAFSKCINLSTVSIPDSVTFIGKYAFNSCSLITELSIPGGTAYVGDNAFKGCNNLTIYCCLNSAAHEYAEKYNVPFIIIDRVTTTSVANLSIDYSNKCIYGFKNGIDDYSSLVAPDSLSLEYNVDSKVATGSLIDVVDGDRYISSYTAVIFGDVNGDGWYDGQDAVTVSMIADGMLTREQVGDAAYKAADCNHDGVIDQADVDLLNQAGVLLSSVDQTKTSDELIETSSEYVEYLNLIDQQTDADSNEAPEDNTQATEDNEEPTELSPWNIIVKYFIALIKKIASVIIAF